MRWLSLLLVCCCVPLAAQSVVVLSEDGRTAWYAPDALTTARPVDRVVRLSGETPGPIPPTDPTPPGPEDRWGLIALSESEADKVQGDPNRNETAVNLGQAFGVIGKQVQDGTIVQAQLKAALELTFVFVTGDAQSAWRSWQNVTGVKYGNETFANATEAGQGVIDIGLGAGKSSTGAIGDGRFLELFMKFLPILLKLIELFGAEEIDTALRGVS